MYSKSRFHIHDIQNWIISLSVWSVVDKNPEIKLLLLLHLPYDEKNWQD